MDFQLRKHDDKKDDDELFAKFDETRKNDLNPKSQKVQKLVAQMQSMTTEFTGGNLKMENNLDRVYSLNLEVTLETWSLLRPMLRC